MGPPSDLAGQQAGQQPAGSGLEQPPAADELGHEAAALLQRLIRFDTVNPPGNERPAIECLRDVLSEAGFECELLAAEPQRPNLVARLRGVGDGGSGAGREGGASAAPGGHGPTLCYLGHVDTVLANPSEWAHDPFSGDIAEGFLWGRGALDMKSQVAAEVAAACSLARSGWRPPRGELLVVAVVDEETGGGVGAQWLTREHPEKVRCDMLVNEGGGPSFEIAGDRFYGVCCAEKGVFRFTVCASGIAAHASMPRMGENALLKLGPALERFAARQPSLMPTAEPLALLRGIGEDADDPTGALARLGEREPRLLPLLEPMFGVTFTPTKISASEKINVIPSSAELRVDCRVPPGLGEVEVLRGIEEVLGGIEGLELDFVGGPTFEPAAANDPSSFGGPALARDPSRGALRIEFTEQMTGNRSPIESELMSAIGEWVAERDPGARTVPTILPGFSDSAHFRAAFPECVAYGFFPHRHQGLLDTQPLIHSADERIDLRDLALGARFYRDLALRLLG
jgi:acetylornithine deacetylase/succinyl-diaminopimelate desuccinylase-like protein